MKKKTKKSQKCLYAKGTIEEKVANWIEYWTNRRLSRKRATLLSETLDEFSIALYFKKLGYGKRYHD